MRRRFEKHMIGLPKTITVFVHEIINEKLATRLKVVRLVSDRVGGRFYVREVRDINTRTSSSYITTLFF